MNKKLIAVMLIGLASGYAIRWAQTRGQLRRYCECKQLLADAVGYPGKLECSSVKPLGMHPEMQMSPILRAVF